VSHGARVYPDLFYTAPNIPAASWWETVDLTLSKAINGDGGGAWTPSAPIIIGGAGMLFGGAWTLSGSASYANASASGKRVTHGDSDYFVLKSGHTGATRTLVTPCARIVDGTATDAAFALNNPYVAASCGYGGGNPVPANTSGAPSYRLFVPLTVHHGATLTQAVITFVVSTSHPGVPTTMPRYRVYRVDASGVVTPLRSASTLPLGFEPFPTPASGAAWTNSSSPQSFTYTINAGTVIDSTKYAYVCEILDESGTNALVGNIYLDVTCTFTTIPDLRAQ